MTDSFTKTEQILKKLVSIDTINEDTEFIEHIINFFPDYTKVRQESGEGYSNFLILNDLAVLAIENNQKYPLFCGHSDTVPITESDMWGVKPHELTLKDGRLYGLGSADMKGGIAAAIQAMTSLEGPSGLLITNREETGLFGSKDILEKENPITNYLLNAEIIIGEPTNMEVGVRHKDCIDYKIKIYGSGGHSSKPYDLFNPILVQAELTLKLNKLGIEFYKKAKNNFETGFSIAPTKIRAGDRLNIVPESCELYFNMRAVDEGDTAIVDEFLDREKEEYGKKGYSINYEVVESFAPFSIKSEEGIVSKALEVLQSNPIELPYTTDASFLSQVKGVECIILGPGNIDVCHRPNEYLERSQLAKAEETYKQIIKLYVKEKL